MLRCSLLVNNMLESVGKGEFKVRRVSSQRQLNRGDDSAMHIMYYVSSYAWSVFPANGGLETENTDW